MVDRISGDDDDVVARLYEILQFPVRLLHESSCFISLNTLAYFFACKKSSSGVIQMVFPVENHHIPVSERLSFVVDISKILFAA